MQLKTFSKQIIASSIFLGALFVLAVIVYSNHPDTIKDSEGHIVDEDTSVLSGEPEREMVPGLPLRLKIPKIHIDAEVEYVGLTSNGEMDVPKSTHNVGWYAPGIRPGDDGNAVIAGHYGWENGEPSAFDELHKLHIGDRIYIEDDAGTVTSFVVRGNRRYEPSDAASDVFNATDEESHLNLIACEGEWDEVSQSYSKRLVVFADRE